jgi:hypothetical protein
MCVACRDYELGKLTAREYIQNLGEVDPDGKETHLVDFTEAYGAALNEVANEESPKE